MKKKLPLFGGQYDSEPRNSVTKYQGAETTWNMIPRADPAGLEEAILAPFPGLTAFATVKSAGSLNARGMCIFADQGDSYVDKIGTIINNEFRFIDAAGTVTASGAGSSAITDTYGNIAMVNQQTGSTSEVSWAPNFQGAGYANTGLYQSTGAGTLGTIQALGTSLADGSPYSIATMNRQLIVEDGESWATSPPGNRQVDGTNRLAEAESFPDRIKRVLTLQPYLYIFGTRSLEIWRNTGTGKPPFSRLPTGVLEHGLRDAFAIGTHRDKIFFLDHESRPMMLQGQKATHIGNPSVDSQLRSNSQAPDTTVMPIMWNGQLMVIFNVRKWTSTSAITVSGTWIWHEAVNMWTRLGDDGGVLTGWAFGHHLHLPAENGVGDEQHIVMNDLDGKLYKLDDTVLTSEGGTALSLERTTQPVASEVLGEEPDQYVHYNKVILTTNPATSANAAAWTLSYSDDGGKTFVSAGSRAINDSSVGATLEVEWNGLGRSKNRIFKLAATQANHYQTLIKLEADVQFGSG